MKTNAELVAALRSYAAQERLASGHRVTEDEVIAYVNGELSGEQRERVEEAISLDPEAAELARDFAMFPEAPAPGEEGYLSPFDLARDWKALRARIDVPEPIPARLAPALALAACLLAVAGLSFWGFLQRSARLETAEQLTAALAPKINVQPYTLHQASPRGTVPGAQRPPDRLDGNEDVFWLRLIVSDQPRYERYRLEVRPLDLPEQSPLWSDDRLKLYSDGTFSVALPRAFLPPGRYELRIVGFRQGRKEPVTAYRIEIPPR